MYKLTTSSRNTDDLSMGFDRSRNRRRDELAQIKNIKSKYHLRIMFKMFFDLQNVNKWLLMALVINQHYQEKKTMPQ